MSGTVRIQKGKLISAFRETILVASWTLAMCGAVLTSPGSPQRWSDVLADQTTEESIANAFHAVVV